MKTNLKNIMRRAWEIYKKAGCTLRAELAVALKMAWDENKTQKNELRAIIAEAEQCMRTYHTAKNSDVESEALGKLRELHSRALRMGCEEEYNTAMLRVKFECGVVVCEYINGKRQAPQVGARRVYKGLAVEIIACEFQKSTEHNYYRGDGMNSWHSGRYCVTYNLNP